MTDCSLGKLNAKEDQIIYLDYTPDHRPQTTLNATNCNVTTCNSEFRIWCTRNSLSLTIENKRDYATFPGKHRHD